MAPPAITYPIGHGCAELYSHGVTHSSARCQVPRFVPGTALGAWHRADRSCFAFGVATRRISFTRSDVHLAGVLFDRMTAEPGRWERMSGAKRWLVLVPESGNPDVKIEVNVGDGDPDAMNLILNVTGDEPGKPVYPDLAERGVTTPAGWILMADVGWVLGWRLPKDTPLEKVSDFAFRATKALVGEPDDGRWIAELVKRGPRPGYTNPKI
jgi:hypothetical protein